MQGKLIILSAPSGSGKTTIINHLLTKDFNLEFSVSATTRAKRPGEKHGKDYYFFTIEDFKNKIANGEFLEYEEVYPGIFYGTLKTEVGRITSTGKNVIFDVDIVGGLNIKNEHKADALAIFVRPPSIESLRQRLQDRSTDTKEEIDMRVGKAAKEMESEVNFDVTVINDKLEVAFIDAVNVVTKFLSS